MSDEILNNRVSGRHGNRVYRFQIERIDNKIVARVIAGGVNPTLVFVDSDAYDIPELTAGVAITNIDVSTGVSGGTPPYVFSARGLPSGVSINSGTGVISGTPDATGAAGNATITVTDSASVSADISIKYGNDNGEGEGGGGGCNSGLSAAGLILLVVFLSGIKRGWNQHV
jgi:hypothetical protein